MLEQNFVCSSPGGSIWLQLAQWLLTKCLKLSKYERSGLQRSKNGFDHTKFEGYWSTGSRGDFYKIFPYMGPFYHILPSCDPDHLKTILFPQALKTT